MTPTPLLDITELGFAGSTRVFAKCENRNPLSQSHYDRVYDYLFNVFMQRGLIKRGKTLLIESSSGNAGTAFARFCKHYGFEGIVVFPSEVRPARVAATAARGVTIEVAPYPGYMKGARRRMLEIAKAARSDGRDIFIMNHSQLWESVMALGWCGQEIVDEFHSLRVRPDLFVSALGNGTSTTGIGLRLRQFFPGVRIFGFEPSCSPVVTNMIADQSEFAYRTSNITGTGVWGIPFPNFHIELIDGVELVEEDEADIARWAAIRAEVNDRFGHSIGLTSCVAIDVARRCSVRNPGETIVTVFYDVGEFY